MTPRGVSVAFDCIVLAIKLLARQGETAILTRHAVRTNERLRAYLYLCYLLPQIAIAAASPSERFSSEPARPSQTDSYDARSAGVTCDGKTDDSEALQRAINNSQSEAAFGRGKRLILPTGVCVTGPLLISGQIEIVGTNSAATVLSLKAGSMDSAITIKPAGYNFPKYGFPNGEIVLQSLRINGGNGKEAHSSYPNQNGIQFSQGNAWGAFVRLNDVTIWNVAGDAINCSSFQGMVQLWHVTIWQTGGNGISANSCFDWRIIDSSIAMANEDGIFLSGSSSFWLYGTDLFTNRRDGLGTYGLTGIKMFGGILDHNGLSGVRMAASKPGSNIELDGVVVAGASQQGLGVSSDVVIEGGDTDTSFVMRGGSISGATVDGGNSSYNLEFRGDSRTTATVTDVTLGSKSSDKNAFSNHAEKVFLSRQAGGASYISGDLRISGTITARGHSVSTIEDVPSSPNAPCTPGQTANSANFHYECVAVNLWSRAKHSTRWP